MFNVISQTRVPWLFLGNVSRWENSKKKKYTNTTVENISELMKASDEEL